MTYIAESFTAGARLRASKLTQLVVNLNEIRDNHQGNDAPSTAELGAIWIDSSSSLWGVYVHDGAAWVLVCRINTSTHDILWVVNPELLADSAIESSHIVADSVPTAAFSDGSIVPGKIANGAIVDEHVTTDAVQSVGNVPETKLSASISFGRSNMILQEGSASGTGTADISLTGPSFVPVCKTGYNSVIWGWRPHSGSPNRDNPTLYNGINAGSDSYNCEWHYLET